MAPPTSEVRPSILKQESREAMSPSALLGVECDISPRATPKSVSINPDAEVMSPLMLGNHKNPDEFHLDDSSSRRVPVRSRRSYRLSGRPSPSLRGMSKRASVDDHDDTNEHGSSSHMPKQIEQVIEDVSTWLRQQRQKRARHRHRPHMKGSLGPDQPHDASTARHKSSRRLSDGSSASLDLDRLEDIIKESLKLDHNVSRRSSLRHRPSFIKHRSGTNSYSSDTEYYDGEPLVPSCDVVLDNSQTIACMMGTYDDSDGSDPDVLRRTRSFKDHDAWATFKYEIVRLTHTLRLKGWRSVSMDRSNSISVERLSGALTNAVYVVSPPENIDEQDPGDQSSSTVHRKRKAQKLLLRIYGPQVGHLIDREKELQVLQRLARKRIGPRLLGTFANGRFEEFFHARTLTPDDVRNPDTSQQIAKRMRELHDGIDLLDEERADKPFAWQNWDKWASRVDHIGPWLDAQVKDLPHDSKPTGTQSWKRRGFICGVEWPIFRATVDKYRAWLVEEYGGLSKIKENMVFAHNDTQYGNILRVEPAGESPLLLPANTHKQLVVIDFEYANANLPGYEFADHFTEWCYNYHDKLRPHVCNVKLYPTPEEQDRFIRAYVRHRPQFNISTPKLLPRNSSSSSINNSTAPNQQLHERSSSSLMTFMLDARTPVNAKDRHAQYDESAELAAEDSEVARLMHETRLWRLSCSAQWVAWGLVQAEVPGMPDFGEMIQQGKDEMAADVERVALEETSEGMEAVAALTSHEADENKEEAEEEFDYLGYAQHRAMFFWGDALQLGLVKAEELPEEMLAKVKTVTY